MQIYLIRHTKPDVEEGVCYGQADLEVDSSFEDSLSKIKSKLPEVDGHIIFTSPLKRCALLAEKLSNHNGIISDDRLLELDFGNWELKRWDSLEEKELVSWGNDFVDNKLHGGESFREMSHRVIEFWEDLIEKKPEKVIIVAHSGTIRVILTILLEIPLRKAFSIKLDYSDIVKVRMIDNDHSEIVFL